jgi:hypothetical protein
MQGRWELHKIQGSSIQCSSQQPANLVYKWRPHGQYTAKTRYDALFQGAIGSASWKVTWETPRVKCFIWLGQKLDSRAPSKERHAAYLLCDQTSETTGHLLVDWPFPRAPWHEVLSWIQFMAWPPTVWEKFIGWWPFAVDSHLGIVKEGWPFPQAPWHEVLSWIQFMAWPPTVREKFIGWWPFAADSHLGVVKEGLILVDKAPSLLDPEAAKHCRLQQGKSLHCLTVSHPSRRSVGHNRSSQTPNITNGRSA